MYKCKHFKIKELVPEDVYLQYKNKQYKLWGMLDERILETADLLREKYGKTFINRANVQMAGYRPSWTKTGNELSQHRSGRALDLSFDFIGKMSLKTKDEIIAEYDKIRDYIVDHSDEFPHVTGLEYGVTWLHIDCGNRETGESKILKFYP